jgi:DNA-binding transcriptional ArsR family regulator
MIEVYRALGDPHRFSIVEMALAGPRHVQELADELGITQPAVSRHVRTLREAGIVDVVREGRKSVLMCPAESASAELRTILAWISRGEDPAPSRDQSFARSTPPTRESRPKPPPPPVRDDFEDYLL